MKAPIKGKMFVTQLFGGAKIPSEAYEYWDGTQNIQNIGHNGVDFDLPQGSPIYAVWDGKIVIPPFQPQGLGTYIILETSDNRQAWYGHLSKIEVTSGQEVIAGQEIALSGNSGNSTGPHLHFAVINPPLDLHNGYLGFHDPITGFDHDIVARLDVSEV